MTLLCRQSFLAVCLLVGGALHGLTLTDGGRSAFVIYVEPGAPGSVREAAVELRDHVKRVSGVELAMADAPATAMVCLGDSAAARAAGLASADLSPEAFRIAVRAGSLFILGPDTPDEGRTAGGGTSTGTRNGVYRFIETALGVRWLLPGPDGDYVPRRETITVAEEDWTEAPGFANRRVPYLQPDRPEVQVWSRRHNLGYSLALSHPHNWDIIGVERFREHPEWFAEHGGQRTPPTGVMYKLCVSNPGLIGAFADAASAYFDAHPEANCFSLSPADGGGWCECGPCTALYETDPRGQRSVTPAIVAFYNEVARRVRLRHPGKLLAGYVYAEYVFPPKQPFRLEPNVFLVWAPSFDYGYALYRPDVQALWDELVPQWTRVTTNLSYYDLPTNVANGIGAPNPPGLGILQFLFPRLKQHGMKGVYVYGNPAWGHAAVSNYLLAKLCWNPNASVQDLFAEFCDKAYGEGGPEMKRFYLLLDAATEAYYRAHAEENYTLSAGRMKAVYAAHFTELEQLFDAARTKITEPAAAARLALLEPNLALLHWTLRQQALLPPDHASRLALTDAGIADLLRRQAGSLAMQRHAQRPPAFSLGLGTVKAGSIATPAPATPYSLRGRQDLVLMPLAEGPVTVSLIPKRTYGSLTWVYLFDAAGKELARSLISASVPFRFDGRAGVAYGLSIHAGRDFFRLAVENARWGLSTAVSDEGLHLIQETTPLYLYVPQGTATFSLWLAASPPGETATAVLTAPDGRAAATFDCSARSVDQQTVAVAAGEAGFWRITIRVGSAGVLDDVYLRLLDGVAPYVVVDPDKALVVVRPGQ
jgi:hypothetical protein